MSTAATEHVLAVIAELKPADRKRIMQAVDEVVGVKDPAKRQSAQRWCAKALKQARGIRKTPMRPGEDGLTDKQREQLLTKINLAPAFVQSNRHRLGFTQ